MISNTLYSHNPSTVSNGMKKLFIIQNNNSIKVSKNVGLRTFKKIQKEKLLENKFALVTLHQLVYSLKFCFDFSLVPKLTFFL
jgi:hypothetical protein